MAIKHFTDGSIFSAPDGSPPGLTLAVVGTTGITGSPTMQLHYQRLGNIVHAYFAGVSGLRLVGLQELHLTGLPTEIRPSAARVCAAVEVIDRDDLITGTMRVNTDGTVDFWPGVLGELFVAGSGQRGVSPQGVSWLV